MFKDNILNIKCVDKYKNKLFILTRDGNELLSYDLETENLSYIGNIQRGASFYCTSCICDGKIYYFSYFDSEICVYDINDNFLSYKNINVTYNEKSFGGCSACVKYENYIYILCNDKHIPMVRLNTKTMNIENVNIWMDYCDEKYNKNVINTSYTNLCIVNDSLLLTTNLSDIILEYNLKTNLYNFIELPKLNIQYYTINFDGNVFWLTGNKKKIVKWNKELNTISEYEKLPIDLEYRSEIDSSVSKGLFYTGFSVKDYIFYAPLGANMFIVLNTKTEEVKSVKKINKKEYCFYFFNFNQEGIWAQIEKIGGLTTETLVFKDFKYKEKKFDLNRINYNNAIYNENVYLTEKFPSMLNWYIEKIINI